MAQSASVLEAKPGVVNAGQRRAAVARARERKVVLPTFSNLASPSTIPESVRTHLRNVDPNAPNAENLWRVNWYNGPDRDRWTELVSGPLEPGDVAAVERVQG
jgi:hypothetical protein